MNSYRNMYYRLLRSVCDAIDLLESEEMKKFLIEGAPQRVIAPQVTDMLIQAIRDCEEIYMEYGDEEDERYDRERDKMLGFITD